MGSYGQHPWPVVRHLCTVLLLFSEFICHRLGANGVRRKAALSNHRPKLDAQLIGIERMYGLSSDVDLKFFQGRTLFQVCCGLHEAILHFDEGVSITTYADIGHWSAGSLTAVYKEICPAAPMLLQFLHQSVVKVDVDPPGSFKLTFSNGEQLEFYDSFEQYESFEIWHGKTHIVV
jgi:hypothetical protein